MDGNHRRGPNKDVTRGKALRTAEQLAVRFGEVLECVPEATFLLDAANRIVFLNHAAAALFGYDRQELIGQTADLLLPSLLRSAALAAGSDCLQRRGVRKTGAEFPVEVSARDFNVDGWSLLLFTARDISQRHHQDQQFDVLLEAAPDAMIIVDAAGLIVRVNSQSEQLFGYARAELIGCPIEVLVPARFTQNHRRDRSRYEKKPSVRPMGVGRQLYGLRKDGSEVAIEISLSPLQTGDGLRIMTAIRDATEHVATHTRLAVRARELARSNVELDQFVHTASHDLKSPLRGIHQLVTWLAADLAADLKPETQERLRLIRTRIDRMDALIADLLSYSQVGRLQDEMVPVDTRALVLQVFSLLAPAKPIILDAAADLPILVTLKTPLELVFRNLMSNAVKHHDKPQGRIEVLVSAQPNGFEFTVADDGPGIDHAYHEKVFEMFQTLRTRDELEGSGIGLALVRKAVASVGGSIALQSSPGSGSIFRFTWPDEASLRARLNAKPDG